MKKRNFLLSCLILLLFTCNQSSTDPMTEEELVVFDFPEEGAGCSSFSLYKYSTNKLQGISIRGNRDDLGLSLQSQSYNLLDAPISVELLEFDDIAGSYYCDDVVGDEASVSNKWIGKRGTVYVKIEQDSVVVEPWAIEYIISVELENTILEKENDTNQTYEIEEMRFDSVYVGWLPG